MEAIGRAPITGEFRAQIAEELERALASDSFRNSKQAERLLRYLVAASLDDHEQDLRERAIGEKIFGRPPKYDRNADSIVRVWANHLRKGLTQYYQAEGRTAALRLTMRPGSYRVEFQPVVEEPPTPPVRDIGGPAAPIRSGLRMSALAFGLAALFAVICGWLWSQNFQLRNQIRPTKLQPPLDRLWSPMFGGKLPAEIVLADSNLPLFQRLLHQPVSLQEYISHDYLLMAGKAKEKSTLLLLMENRFTSTASVDILRRVLPLAGPDGNRLEVYFARDFPADDLKKRNVILVGSRHSNPWVEPFESRMNFRVDYDESRSMGFLVNKHPQPGEQAMFMDYPAAEATKSFALVAFQPNLSHSGNALLICGQTMHGTMAGGELVTNPDLFKQVVDRLGVTTGAGLPYFEAVLSTDTIGGTIFGAKIVAWRRD